MLFLTITNENNFFKTQITRLGARVAPNKGLEQGPPSIYESVNPCHAIVLFIYSLRVIKMKQCEMGYCTECFTGY